MISVLFVDVGGTIIAEYGEEEEEIGSESFLEPEDEQEKDEYVEEEGDGEDTPFEGSRRFVEVEDVEVGFGGQGLKEG